MHAGATRKLEDVSRELTPLAEQGAIVGFFSNIQNADELGRLVEDIRHAIMDYQVRPAIGIHPPITCLTSASDIAPTRSL